MGGCRCAWINTHFPVLCLFGIKSVLWHKQIIAHNHREAGADPDRAHQSQNQPCSGLGFTLDNVAPTASLSPLAIHGLRLKINKSSDSKGEEKHSPEDSFRDFFFYCCLVILHRRFQISPDGTLLVCFLCLCPLPEPNKSHHTGFHFFLLFFFKGLRWLKSYPTYFKVSQLSWSIRLCSSEKQQINTWKGLRLIGWMYENPSVWHWICTEWNHVISSLAKLIHKCLIIKI